MSYSIDLTLPTIKAEIRRLPAWAWLILIAAPLRFITLGHEALWYDEAYTAWLAKLDIGLMFKAILGDVHPPLWYLVEWYNLRLFGSSELALRLPNAVLGVLCVLLVWRLALLLDLDRPTAFVAGLLMAVLPGMIYYSQDARMYPLLTFFLLWALISAIKGKWRYFQIACIGALYTQYTAAFYIGVLFIGCFIYYFRDWRQLRRLRNSWAWISFGMLPWLPFLQSQASNLYFKYWIPRLTLSSAMLPSAEMTVGWRLPDGLLAHAYAAAFALTIVGLIASRHWIRQDKGVLWLAFTFGGPGLLAVVSVLWSPIFISRVILPAVACLIITWAYALQHLSTANRRIARLIVVPVVALSLAYHYWPDPTVARYDARVPMETISNQARSGDVVFYVEAESAVVFQYYNARLPYRLLPERGDLAQSLTDDTKAAMGLQMQSFDSLKDSGFKRVWLIASDNPLSSAEELQQIEWIKAHYQVELVRVDQRPSAEIYVYLVVL